MITPAKNTNYNKRINMGKKPIIWNGHTLAIVLHEFMGNSGNTYFLEGIMGIQWQEHRAQANKATAN